MNDVDPDYVIAGETNTYNYQTILKAVDLINKGARLIATNSDLTGPSEQGILPACRALVSPIELATGKTAYYVGKPNPLMMRTGLRLLGVHSHEAAMIATAWIPILLPVLKPVWTPFWCSPAVPPARMWKITRTVRTLFWMVSAVSRRRRKETV